MRYRASMEIDAAPDRVWAVLADVAHWPNWTPTMRRVEPLDPTPPDAGTLRPGSRVRIDQPRLPRAVWEVTEWNAGHSFAWVSRSPGVATVGDHRLEPRPGGVTFVQVLEQTGGLEPLARLFLGGLIRRYLRLEAEGLKRHCESPA